MKVPYSLKSMADAVALIDKDKPVFADTETKGLYGEVRLLQLMQAGWDEVILVENPPAFELVHFMKNYHTVWHNAHYDITTVQQNTGKFVPDNFDDTFLLARLHFCDKEKFSLDEVLAYVLGYDIYERQRLNKKILQKSNWAAPKLTEDQYLYAASDVWEMPALWEAVKEHLDTPSYKLDMLTLKYCLDFQWNGMPVDQERMFYRAEAIEAKVEEIKPPININSWQQVRPYIGETESDDEALARFSAAGNERAANVRETRKLVKQLSFIKKFDGERVYGKFLPSTRSGRLASKDQNLQQLPRSLKDCFGFQPEQGRVLIYADYAQLELRTICAITTCLMMEKIFRDGQDLHGYTAAMLFGESWTKAQRQLTKTYNFSYLYGGGVNMCASILLKTAGIILDEAQGNKDRRRWQNLWKEIFAWQQRGISAWRKGRLGSTPLGRRYKAKMMTDQLNIENQGAGAEVAKLALHYLMPKLRGYEDSFLCNFIHDSFIIEAPADPKVYEPLANDLAESMQEAWFEMSKLFPIKDLPMPVDVKVGYNWGDIESDPEDRKYPLVYEFSLEPYKMLEQVNA